MRAVTILIYILLCACFFASSAQAYPVSNLRLSELVDQSALVVVGQIVSVDEGQVGERQKFGSTSFSKAIPVFTHFAVLRAELVISAKENGCKPGDLIDFQFMSNQGRIAHQVAFHKFFKAGERWLLFLDKENSLLEQGQKPIPQMKSSPGGTENGILEPINPLTEQELKIPEDVILPKRLSGSPLEQTERLLAGFLSNPNRDFVLEVLQYFEYGTYAATYTKRAAEDLSHPRVPMGGTLRYNALATPEALTAVTNLLNSPDIEIRGASGFLVDTPYI